jgi:hypothetical protein
MSQYGIKETKEAIVFGIKFQTALRSALADGKLGIGDLDEAFSIIAPLQAAIEGGWKIPLELADLQPGEFDELLAVAAPLVQDLTPDALEPYVWKVLSGVKFILEGIGLIK